MQEAIAVVSKREGVMGMRAIIYRKLIVIMAVVFLAAVGCDLKDKPKVRLTEYARSLKEIYADWLAKGRSTNFFTVDYTTASDGTYFIFTNQVTVAERIYHCRFGARMNGWPSGLLTITDEGDILWIRNRDGWIQVSPEKVGFPDSMF